MPQHEKSIFDTIRFAHLVGDDGPTDLNWRQVAELLADELDAIALRLSGDPNRTEADEERVARAIVAIRQFRAACAEADQT